VKFRIGFVSNSSSSSFIVAFSKKPSSLDDLQQALFGENERYYSPWGDWALKVFEENSWPVEKIAGVVLNDLKDQKPMTKEEVIEAFKARYYSDDLDEDPCLFKNEKGETDWEALRDAEAELGEKEALKFIEKNKGKLFFDLTYSDNDGHMYSSMEHGDLFARLPHFKFSHH
jgi:hypothetical protein